MAYTEYKICVLLYKFKKLYYKPYIYDVYKLWPSRSAPSLTSIHFGELSWLSLSGNEYSVVTTVFYIFIVSLYIYSVFFILNHILIILPWIHCRKFLWLSLAPGFWDLPLDCLLKLIGLLILQIIQNRNWPLPNWLPWSCPLNSHAGGTRVFNYAFTFKWPLTDDAKCIITTALKKRFEWVIAISSCLSKYK